MGTPTFFSSAQTSSAQFPFWTGPALRISTLAGYEIPVALASTGAILGTTFRVVIVRRGTSVGQNGSSTPDYQCRAVDYQIRKLPVAAASLDTRKTYGQPNREGELPGDANAPPAEISFANWVYRGGLFVGNAPWTSNDQSGLARIQLWAGGDANAHVATLSMFHQGYHPKFPDAINVGVYVPRADDPNLAETTSQARWPLRWDIAPRSAPTDPNAPDYSKDPYAFTKLGGGTNPGDFVTWPLSKMGSFDHTIPPRALQTLTLAMKNEDTMVSSSAAAWRYLASETFAATQTGKLADTAPRIWVAEPVWASGVDNGTGYGPLWEFALNGWPSYYMGS